MLKRFLFGFLILSGASLHAQANLKDSIVSASIINIDLGIGIPAGDLAKRFGGHMSVGGGYQFKTQKNFIIGLNGAFNFGNIIHEDSVLRNIQTDAGFLIGIDGAQYIPELNEEVVNIEFQFGKITNLFAINPNSGVAFIGGIGYMQHKINFYIDEKFVPQLDSEAQKGYDRFSNGMMLHQYIGYYVFSNKHFVAFKAGFEVNEGFTKNRRSYNFDTNSQDNSNRIDVIVTFKVSWNLAVYEKPNRKFYKY